MRVRLAVYLLCFLVVLAMPRAAAAEPVAIVVHPSFPLQDLPLDTVKDLLLGRVTHLTELADSSSVEDARVRILIHRSAEEPILAQLLEMSTARFRRRWVRLILSGNAALSPTFERNPVEALLAVVASDPSAIGIVLASDISPSVRALRISGLTYTDEKYFLR